MKHRLYLMMICLLAGLGIIKLKKKKETIYYDLIVKFKEDSYIDIRDIHTFHQLSHWSRFGNYGFRGKITYNLEQLKQLIKEELMIGDEDYEVIYAQVKGEEGSYEK